MTKQVLEFIYKYLLNANYQFELIYLMLYIFQFFIDPFNRQPLTLSMIEPLPELKQTYDFSQIFHNAYKYNIKLPFIFSIDAWLEGKGYKE